MVPCGFRHALFIHCRRAFRILMKSVPKEAMMGDSPAKKSATINRSEWLLLLVLASVQFTNILDFVIVMPLAPQAKQDLQITSNQFGHIVGAYGFAACFGSLLAAKYRKKTRKKEKKIN